MFSSVVVLALALVTHTKTRCCRALAKHENGATTNERNVMLKHQTTMLYFRDNSTPSRAFRRDNNIGALAGNENQTTTLGMAAFFLPLFNVFVKRQRRDAQRHARVARCACVRQRSRRVFSPNAPNAFFHATRGARALRGAMNDIFISPSRVMIYNGSGGCSGSRMAFI